MRDCIAKPRITYPLSASSMLLRMFLFITLLAVVFIYAFELGQHTELESSLLQGLVSKGVCGSQKDLEQMNDALRARITNLERSSQIDRHSTLEEQAKIKDLQAEVQALKSEVAFYQRIVAPGEEESGLRLQDMKIEVLAATRHYRYSVVLNRVKQSNSTVQGMVKIRVQGSLAGKPKTLSLSDISRDGLKSHKLKFKFYQKIEGEIKLPKNFVPGLLAFEVSPTGKGVAHFSKKFEWLAKQAGE